MMGSTRRRRRSSTPVLGRPRRRCASRAGPRPGLDLSDQQVEALAVQAAAEQASAEATEGLASFAKYATPHGTGLAVRAGADLIQIGASSDRRREAARVDEHQWRPDESSHGRRSLAVELSYGPVLVLDRISRAGGAGRVRRPARLVRLRQDHAPARDLRVRAGARRPHPGRRARHPHLPPEQRGMAMVFQSYALWPHMTTAQNLGYGLRLRGVPRAGTCSGSAKSWRCSGSRGWAIAR